MDPKNQSCLDACNACATACDHCVSACLQEDDITEMALCIELDQQCAILCRTASALMALDSEYAMETCRVCAEACRDCAEECRKFEVDHCQQCADACEKCAQECERMAEAMV